MSEFAIIKTGGKQYKVKVDDIIKVEKIQADKKIELEDILNKKKVVASVIGDGKHPKVRILKFKPKKRYKKIIGHRQAYTQIKIEAIH